MVEISLSQLIIHYPLTRYEYGNRHEEPDCGLWLLVLETIFIINDHCLITILTPLIHIRSRNDKFQMQRLRIMSKCDDRIIRKVTEEEIKYLVLPQQTGYIYPIVRLNMSIIILITQTVI